MGVLPAAEHGSGYFPAVGPIDGTGTYSARSRVRRLVERPLYPGLDLLLLRRLVALGILDVSPNLKKSRHLAEIALRAVP
jgi:hypothetical protein